MTSKERNKVIKIFKGLYRYKTKKNTINISEVEEKYSVYNYDSKRSDEIMYLLYTKLSENEKRYIDLYFKENLSVLEISRKLYVSESTYYRRMRKIFSKLLIYIKEFEAIFKAEY